MIMEYHIKHGKAMAIHNIFNTKNDISLLMTPSIGSQESSCMSPVAS